MLIHFICRGNSYRSRLAEAYLNSKQIQGLNIISTGITASKNINGPISWPAARIAKRNNLINFMFPSWRETTKDLLNKSDLVVFMTKHHLDFCRENLNFGSHNYEVWEIGDLEKYGLRDCGESYQEDLKIMEMSDMTFNEIKKKVDELVLKLQKQTDG